METTRNLTARTVYDIDMPLADWGDTASRVALRPTSEQKADVATRKKALRYQRSMLHVLITLSLIWFLLAHVVNVTVMPSADMSPAIHAGDLLVISRFDTDVHASDVVAFSKHSIGDAVSVGRVVAMAGDTVDVRDGHVIVNGNSLREQGIYSDTQPADSSVSYPLSLAEGQCFVLADNRTDGVDSRYFGPVGKDELLGTVLTIMRRNNL